MKPLSIDMIRERNIQLERDVADPGNKLKRQRLVKKITELLNDVVCLSELVDSFDDYRWLGDMAIRWHAILSKNLGEPIPMVSLAKPRQPWLPPASATFSEEEIEVWLRGWSDLIKYANLNQHRNQNHYNFLAKVVFASEVLLGRINFVQRISPQSYKLLESLWLKDVKLLGAYFESERKGMEFDHEMEDFFSACNYIRDMLDNTGIKAQISEFGVVKKFLIEHYVDPKSSNRKPSYQTKNSTESDFLIKNKAYRIFETTGATDLFTNWIQAETYVKMFYENIIPAVEEKDREKVLRVIKALQYSKMNRFLIINCFETALAIYFLDVDIIRSIWDESSGKSVPVWTVEQIVNVNSWPKDFSLDGKCRDRFWWDSEKVGFKGVMCGKEKNTLLDALKAASHGNPHADHVKAIEDLYIHSRHIQRYTTL